MLNYVKSEWYRITHSKAIYVFNIVMAGLTLILNVVHYVLDKVEPSFPYGTTAFTLSYLASGMTMMFLVGAVVVSLLYSGDKKNGLMKNAIAFGISREKMFLGRCIVSCLVSVCSLIVILIVYIGSAVLLFEPGIEPDAVGILLRGVLYTLPMAIASEVLVIASYDYFDKELIAYLFWYIIMALLPKVCALLGLKFTMFAKVAAWMPWNYLTDEVMVNMSGWNCMWETFAGAAKSLISGIIGLVVFVILGWDMCRKQEH